MGDWDEAMPKDMQEIGRGDMIRTCDPLVPNQMRYRTAPRPDWKVKHSNMVSRVCASRQKKRVGATSMCLWLWG